MGHNKAHSVSKGIVSEENLLEKEIIEERSFLHDISNLLVVAQGMSNYVFGKLKEEKPEDSKEVIRLGKSLKAINDMVDLVKQRREAVKAKGP